MMPFASPFSLRMLRWLAYAAALPLALLCTAAQACTPAESGGALGSVSSQRISGGPSVTGSGTFSLTCSSTVISALVPAPTLKGTIQATTTGLTLKNTGNSAITIPYQIYSDGGYTTTYTGGLVVVNLNGITLLNLLNASSTSTTIPIYISTTPGAVVPAGTYTDTVSVTWVYANICEGGVNVAGLCLGTLNNGTVTRTITVSLIVTNDCTITAPSVVFGSAPLVGGFPTISQNISLVCSKSMSYTVGMGAGGNPVSGGGRRQMSSGANLLQYDIFKADSTVWGGSGTARATGPAAADGVSVQTIPYTARVYSDQTTPAVGNYTDSVMVDVSF